MVSMPTACRSSTDAGAPAASSSSSSRRGAYSLWLRPAPGRQQQALGDLADHPAGCDDEDRRAPCDGGGSRATRYSSPRIRPQQGGFSSNSRRVLRGVWPSPAPDGLLGRDRRGGGETEHCRSRRCTARRAHAHLAGGPVELFAHPSARPQRTWYGTIVEHTLIQRFTFVSSSSPRVVRYGLNIDEPRAPRARTQRADSPRLLSSTGPEAFHDARRQGTVRSQDRSVAAPATSGCRLPRACTAA